jgi:hypothetical protein
MSDTTNFPGAVDTPGRSPSIPFLATAVVALEEYALAHGTKPTITGALSSVTDTNAKAVLTSIIAALVANDLAVDGTT